MILGEAQVQGQVKRAYEAALALDTTGVLTNRLFGAALATGKRVRAETAIGKLQLSVPSVAVALARERIGELSGHEVVIIGTGEMGELTARALASSGAKVVFVASRRRDRAISLAQRYHGSSVSFDELPEALERADIVVAATASPHLLLEAEEVDEVMRGRDGRPLLLIDLAVPRDIEAMCGTLDGVTLVDIDDLQAVAQRNRRGRQAEATKAEGIIEEEIQHFAAWLGGLEVLPTVAAMRAQAARIAADVVSENEGKWETLSDRDRARVEAIARTIVNRLLHEPTLRMREMRDDRVHARMALVRELFGLDAEAEAVGDPTAPDAPRDDGASLEEIARRQSRAPAAGSRLN
jgi:glutamyl-tRNA reductase